MRAWMMEARKGKKLTQAELARAIGVSQRSVAAYEAGERTPSTKTAKKAGEQLGVSWERFYDDEEGGEAGAGGD